MTIGRARSLRITALVAGLAVVAALVSAVVAGHQVRTRGLLRGVPPPVAGADVPALGVNVALDQYDDAELNQALTRISDAGFTWVRQPFYWRQIEPESGLPDWTDADRIIDAVAKHRPLHLIAVLEDDPPTPPDRPERFAAFAGAFAARYGDRVDEYQIWDEPNLASKWGGGPVSPPAYADLLARSARAIRAVDGRSAHPDGPGARILLAALAPTTEPGPQNLSEVRFLERLYEAGAAPNFDVVAGKPYGFDTGPDDRRAGEDVLNFSRLILLRETMVRHGDAGKAVWASHWGWNSLPSDWSGAPSVWGQTDELTQAARTVAALERARSEWPWTGALVLDHYQPLAGPDDARWGFALVGQDDVPRPVFNGVATWAASVPNAAPTGGYPARNRWAEYEGDWRVGPLGADIGSDGDRGRFRFDGTAVALTVRRGPYRAYLHVTVDGEPANGLPRDERGRAYVVLYDEASEVATVPLASDLAPGVHTVEIVAERGWHQWAVVDWRVGTTGPPDGYGWRLAGLAAAGVALLTFLVLDLRRVAWAQLGVTFLQWPQWTQIALAVGFTGLLWAASALALTWPDFPAASAWGAGGLGGVLFAGLVALLALVAVSALRPEVMLSLIAFSAPLYMVPGGMIYRALSMPEILTVACAVGLAVRGRLARCAEPGRARPRPMLTRLDWSVVALIVAAIVGTTVATDLGAALLELRTVFLLPALFYLLVRASRPAENGVGYVVAGWMLGGITIAVIGLAQYAFGIRVALAEGGLPRLRSVYSSPNSVGLYLGRAWPILLAGAFWGRQKWTRLLSGLALAPVTAALVLSFSRGALLLGLPAAILIVGWWAGGRYRWVAVGLVAAFGVALVPLLHVPRFASMFDMDQGSTFFRLGLWRSSLAMIRDHPWLGVGPGQFAEAYRTRYILPGAWSEPNLGHAHNIVLDHWTRLGGLGLVAGIAVQWAFWQEMVRSRRTDLAAGGGRLALLTGLAGSMAALLAHGLVDNTVFSPDMAMVFFLTLGLAPTQATAGEGELDSG